MSSTELRLIAPQLVEALAERSSGGFQFLRFRPPFVGREEELAVLLDAVGGASATRSLHQVWVTGEEGCGKSRLCQELWERMADADSLIEVREASVTHEGSSAMVLCRQLLRDCLELSPGESHAATAAKLELALASMLGPKRRADATGLLASLLGAPLPEPLLPPTAGRTVTVRRRALKRLAAVIQHDAQTSVQVLVLDGMHWIEPGTLPILTELLSDLRESAVVAVFLSRGAPSNEMLVAKAEQQTIELGPLPPPTATALLSAVLGLDADEPQPVAPLIEATQGNPRRLGELVALLARRGVIELGAEGLELQARRLESMEIPRDAVGITEARLAELTGRERTVLIAAALFGHRFWFDGVLSVFWAGPSGAAHELPAEDRIERRLQETLAGLLEADYVRLSPNSAVVGSPEFVFSNEREAAQLLAAMAPEERRDLELLAGRYMLHAPPVDGLCWYPRVARLLDGSGNVHDAGRAWLKAAQAVADTLEIDRALAAFQEALTRLGPGRMAEQLPAFLGAARCYERARRHHEALDTWNQVYRCGRVLGDRALTARALVAQGRALRCVGENTRAHEVLSLASTACLEAGLVGGKAETERERALLERAAGGQGSVAREQRHHERALEAWLKAGDEAEVAASRVDLARCWLQQALPAKAESELRAALAYYEAQGDQVGILRVRNVQAGLLAVTGDEAGAIELWRQAARATTEGGARSSYALFAVNLADAYIADAEPQLAEERAREALDVAEDVGDELLAGFADLRIACALSAQEPEEGRLEVARVHAQRALERAKMVNSRHLKASAMRQLATVGAALMFAQGEQDDAKLVDAINELYSAAREVAERLDDRLVLAGVLEAIAAFGGRFGDDPDSESARMIAAAIRTQLMLSDDSGIDAYADTMDVGIPETPAAKAHFPEPLLV